MPSKSMSKEKFEYERNIILDCSLAIVSEEGYGGVSMRKIGKLCDFSHTKVYYYFSNKDEILLSLVDNGFSILKDRVENECDKISDSKDKLIACLKEIYRFGINEPNYFNLIFGIEVPKYTDFLSKEVSNNNLDAYMKKATQFYSYYSNIVSDYAKSINLSLSNEEIINIFIQISGIVWVENARLLKEIGQDKDILFESTLESIILSLNLKSEKSSK